MYIMTNNKDNYTRALQESTQGKMKFYVENRDFKGT